MGGDLPTSRPSWPMDDPREEKPRRGTDRPGGNNPDLVTGTAAGQTREVAAPAAGPVFAPGHGQARKPRVGAAQPTRLDHRSSEEPLKGQAHERCQPETRLARLCREETVGRVTKPWGRNVAGRQSPRDVDRQSRKCCRAQNLREAAGGQGPPARDLRCETLRGSGTARKRSG
jgi:hypothetical protein